MKENLEDEWYTPQELALLLKVEYITVIRQLNAKKIPGLKIGRLWRIHKSVVEELTDSARKKKD